MKDPIITTLCKGRHEIPGVSMAIFDNTVKDPMDFESMEKHFLFWYVANGGRFSSKYGSGLNQKDYTEVEVASGTKPVVIYVTGLTPALTSVIAVCAYNGIPLTLMHYDASTGTYKPQTMWH